MSPRHERQGAQPGYYVLKQQRRSISGTADAIGVPYIHLRNALSGHVLPSEAVRERLPLFMGVDLEDLFTAEVLGREHQPKYGRKR